MTEAKETSESKVPNYGNRNPIKQWAITFPQYQQNQDLNTLEGESAAEILDKTNFYKIFPPSNYAICCEETHEDGGLHLHMGLKLLKGISKKK